MVLPMTRTFGLDHATTVVFPVGERANVPGAGLAAALHARHERKVDDACRAGPDR